MRSRLGLTQKQIAKATGLTEQDISRIENGADNPFIETFILLARYFNISINAFVHNDLKIALSSFTKPPQILHNNSKRIKAKRDKCDEIGHKGERWVYKEEYKKLRGTGHENGINPNFADNDEANFDLLSFDLNGRAIIIEVKTTTGDESDPFFISSNEINMAKQCIRNGKCYEIHRVHNINNPQKSGRVIITAEELFENFDFIPEIYKVVQKEKDK